jgi:glycosyltransferase involved in cell wall biosynthesis
MLRHRALILLSEIEGFGLPAIEAYAHGLPVCYRNTAALAEILTSAPGGCDGDRQDEFNRALDTVLAMPHEAIMAQRARLLALCRWEQCAETMIEEYRTLLSSHDGSNEARHHESSVSYP